MALAGLPGLYFGNLLKMCCIVNALDIQSKNISVKLPPFQFPSRLPFARRMVQKASAAFTLVEMLVVMGVILIIIGVATPAINSLGGAADVNKAVYDIAGLLEQARAYAMSNNTYVYVGFHEADANTSESGQQIEVKAPKVGGRVCVAVIASKDGTRGYDVNDSTNSWDKNYNSGAAFLTIGKVQRFRNLHIVDLDTPPTDKDANGSGMVRGPFPTADGTSTKLPDIYNLGNTSCVADTYFEYPLGNAKNKGTYTFVRVIQYDPQGVARLQTSTNSDTITKLIEIGLQQSHGSATAALAKPAKTGSIAALQIECMTGSTHIYRP